MPLIHALSLLRAGQNGATGAPLATKGGGLASEDVPDLAFRQDAATLLAEMTAALDDLRAKRAKARRSLAAHRDSESLQQLVDAIEPARRQTEVARAAVGRSQAQTTISPRRLVKRLRADVARRDRREAVTAMSNRGATTTRARHRAVAVTIMRLRALAARLDVLARRDPAPARGASPAAR